MTTLAAILRDRLGKLDADAGVHRDALLRIEAERAGVTFALDAAEKASTPATAPTRAAKGAIERDICLCFDIYQPDGNLPDTLNVEQFIALLPTFKPDSVKATLRRLVRLARLDLVDGRYRLHIAEPVLALKAAE